MLSTCIKVGCACTCLQSNSGCLAVWASLASHCMPKLEYQIQWEALSQTVRERTLKEDSPRRPLTCTCTHSQCTHAHTSRIKVFTIEKQYQVIFIFILRTWKILPLCSSLELFFFWDWISLCSWSYENLLAPASKVLGLQHVPHIWLIRTILEGDRQLPLAIDFLRIFKSEIYASADNKIFK